LTFPSRSLGRRKKKIKRKKPSQAGAWEGEKKD